MDHCVFPRTRHVPHGIEHESFLEPLREIPRHHFAARNIFHDREVGVEVLEWDVGDVGTKYGPRDSLAEVPLELVGEYPVLQPLLHHGLVRIPPPHASDEPVRPHEALYFLVIHLGKPHFHASPAVCAFPLVEDLFELEVVSVVLAGRIGGREPLVVSASRYTPQFAEHGNITAQSSDHLVFFVRPEFDSARLARSLAKKSFSALRYLTCSFM